MKIFLVLFVLMIFSAPTLSQSDDFVPIWGDDRNTGGIMPYSLYWSFDSQNFYFNASQFGESLSFEYDILSGEFSEMNFYRPTLQLSEDQQAHYRAQDSRAYLAPNHDTFVYVSTYKVFRLGEGYGGELNLLAVGNLSDPTFILTQLPASTDIRWSDDSTGFVVQYSHSSYAGIGYAIDTGGCSWNFCRSSETGIATLEYGQSIFDISPNGERVLFEHYARNTLTLWDVRQHANFFGRTSEGIQIPVENVTGAAFVRDSPEKILVVASDGIIEYDIHTQESEVINSAISSAWAGWAMFSPDNQWVAVLADGRVAFHKLYVLPVNP